jgi:hypothetical protein
VRIRAGQTAAAPYGEFDVTTFVSRVSATVPALPSTRFTGLRSALHDWAHAFRAAARSPRPEGMDPVALRTFGRV